MQGDHKRDQHYHVLWLTRPLAVHSQKDPAPLPLLQEPDLQRLQARARALPNPTQWPLSHGHQRADTHPHLRQTPMPPDTDTSPPQSNRCCCLETRALREHGKQDKLCADNLSICLTKFRRILQKIVCQPTFLMSIIFVLFYDQCHLILSIQCCISYKTTKLQKKVFMIYVALATKLQNYKKKHSWYMLLMYV